jgi:hypothetical protein
MPRRAATLTMSFLLAITLIMTSFQTAEARRGRGAAIVGGVALGMLALGAMDAYGRPYHAAGVIAARANAAGSVASAIGIDTAIASAVAAIGSAGAPLTAIE